MTDLATDGYMTLEGVMSGPSRRTPECVGGA